MDIEEFKEYVNEMNKSITDKLKDTEEELAFYVQLVKRFNDVCEERNNLEQTLNEIKNILNSKGEMNYE